MKLLEQPLLLAKPSMPSSGLPTPVALASLGPGRANPTHLGMSQRGAGTEARYPPSPLPRVWLLLGSTGKQGAWASLLGKTSQQGPPVPFSDPIHLPTSRIGSFLPWTEQSSRRGGVCVCVCVWGVWGRGSGGGGGGGGGSVHRMSASISNSESQKFLHEQWGRGLEII